MAKKWDNLLWASNRSREIIAKKNPTLKVSDLIPTGTARKPSEPIYYRLPDPPEDEWERVKRMRREPGSLAKGGRRTELRLTLGLDGLRRPPRNPETGQAYTSRKDSRNPYITEAKMAQAKAELDELFKAEAKGGKDVPW